MPRPLRTVQLSDLQFLDNGGNWYDLITEMRTLIQKQALWPNRHIRVALSLSDAEDFGLGVFGRRIWLENEVHDFLYGSGQNPFYEPEIIGVEDGFGIGRDVFEPNHNRPRIHRRDLE